MLLQTIAACAEGLLKSQGHRVGKQCHLPTRKVDAVRIAGQLSELCDVRPGPAHSPIPLPAFAAPNRRDALTERDHAGRGRRISMIT